MINTARTSCKYAQNTVNLLIQKYIFADENLISFAEKLQLMIVIVAVFSDSRLLNAVVLQLQIL